MVMNERIEFRVQRAMRIKQALVNSTGDDSSLQSAARLLTASLQWFTRGFSDEASGERT